MMAILVSIGGWFEFYDLFFTAYVGPGLVKSGIYRRRPRVSLDFRSRIICRRVVRRLVYWDRAVFGTRGSLRSPKDIYRIVVVVFGRHLHHAFQETATAINIWGWSPGSGLASNCCHRYYVSELVPTEFVARIRADPPGAVLGGAAVALLAWWFEPRQFLSLSAGAGVVIIGALGAVVVWFIRLSLPESPRWLAQRGRFDKAEEILARLERTVAAQSGRPLPPPQVAAPVTAQPGTTSKARFKEIWQPPYRRRTITMLVFNLFQSLGFYALRPGCRPCSSRARDGHAQFALFFVIAISNPFGPLISMTIADRFERKR